MKSFEVCLLAAVRETPLRPGSEGPFEKRELTVRIEMGDDAKPEDAVAELARRLERLGETPDYEGG